MTSAAEDGGMTNAQLTHDQNYPAIRHLVIGI
jgi:hypothetical protein